MRTAVDRKARRQRMLWRTVRKVTWDQGRDRHGFNGWCGQIILNREGEGHGKTKFLVTNFIPAI